MKARTILGVFTLAIMLHATGAFASENAKNLDDCYAGALKRSEVVATQVELIRQAEERYVQARGTLLPTISGVASYLRQESATNNVGQSVSPPGQPLVKVTGAQPLFQGFREFAGLHQTKSLIRASQHDRRQAERQLWVDVASAFLGVLSLEKDLANVQTEISLYGDRVGELERYRKIGRSRPSEVLTVQSAQALLKAQADQLQGVIRVNRDVLAFLTGFEWNVPLTNAGAAPEAPKPIESYLADLERRPDVLGDTEREEAAQSGITIARGGHYPTIAAGGDYFFKRYGSLSDVNWDVSVALVMPIFNGGITQSQVDFARSQQRQAAFQVSRTKRLAEQEIRSLYDTLAADREQLESLRIANSLAEKSYRADLGEYRRGLVTNLDVLQAMQAFQESGRAMDRQVYQLSLDVEKLEAAVDRRPPRTADGSKTP